MAEKQQEWRLYSGQYLGEISALCFLHHPAHLSSLPYLLAGSGSQVLVYDLESGTTISSFRVFDGIRVHGIACSLIKCREEFSVSSLSYELVVFGEKRVKMFTLSCEFASGAEGGAEVRLHLSLLHSLPKFAHWVLDVLFLEGLNGTADGDGSYLVIGCSNNSVHVWDISSSAMLLKVQSSDRCLLYSLKFWGNSLDTLQIASGTIYNEVIVWKIVPCSGSACQGRSVKENTHMSNLSSTYLETGTTHICRLIGHEGSIFRIGWSCDGSRLVSVSDDRSARIWSIHVEQNAFTNGNDTTGTILFGHSARVWDCCFSDNLIVTAGEDCTCRLWGKDGTLLGLIKGHTGRGVWRCLYDPNSSVLITAGFDSAIKVHQVQLQKSSECNEQSRGHFQFKKEPEFTVRIPNLSGQIGLMDSKSEYVRFLHFKCEDSLYVATNHGYLYHAQLSDAGHVNWTELIHLKEEVPVVSMDICCFGSDDWIALGDGKGNMTIVVAMGDCPQVCFVSTWPAARERQLLGAYWCKSLGFSYVFTSDPRGCLKLWQLFDPTVSGFHYTKRTCPVTLVAEFCSGFGIRIMCLDALLKEELLVCGDLRGNIVLFRLSKDLLLGALVTTGVSISPICCFKGAHGISSVSVISVARLSSSQIELRSTGADGCICFFEFDKGQLTIEFVGLKQVKELSLIESVSADHKDVDDLANCKYVAGFASVDFIIWNVVNETKVLQIPCGGWRRPHSFYIGDLPEMMNCFAYVKDELIYIHRQWLPESVRMLFPKTLHVQFHGKELHSLCFVDGKSHIQACGKESLLGSSSWIATGCEDGSVRLTRFTPELESWSESKLLGEHVGGSSVRSLCFVSKTHILRDSHGISGGVDGQTNGTQGENNQCVLISVGAKRVLTSWMLRSRGSDKKGGTYVENSDSQDVNGLKPSSEQCSSLSFRWLATDQPTRAVGIQRRDEITNRTGDSTNLGNLVQGTSNLGKRESELKFSRETIDEDDWRYLAVTAFLVQCSGSRLTVCFIVVACSDATLTLRALLLPHRLWFDVAELVPAPSPILSLQHVVIPVHPSFKEKSACSSIYMVISGATDGSITFWDITEGVNAFVRHVSSLQVEKFIDCQRRPRTGRGSQGGRSWRTLDALLRRSNGVSVAEKTADEAVNIPLKTSSDSGQVQPEISTESETEKVKYLAEICEIRPTCVVNNVHQSGVNCLCVSLMECRNCLSEEESLFCVASGGDDQALNFLNFSVSFSPDLGSRIIRPMMIRPNDKLESIEKAICFSQQQIMNYQIQFIVHQGIASAHSSAIKGIWTDGKWIFSTGLDQRVRCWKLEEHCQLIEHSHLITSVPEPEALDARPCGRNHYQITVAGRGIQMLEFSADLY